MLTQSPLLYSEPRHDGPLSPDHLRWINFNRQLTRDATLFLPNERSIEERLEALLQMQSGDLRIFWLTFSRIAELALKQAGDYADNCEFQAAGDLLVNPRQINIYRRGRTTPVLKDRHRCLSDQFATAIGNENPVTWLSRETLPHIRAQALLPHMKEMLSASGFMAPAYMDDLDRRMSRVADTIAFLTAWQIDDCTQLFKRMETATPDDKKIISVNLCRFGLEPFTEMGDDMEKIIFNDDGCSRFLDRRGFRPAK